MGVRYKRGGYEVRVTFAGQTITRRVKGPESRGRLKDCHTVNHYGFFHDEFLDVSFLESHLSLANGPRRPRLSPTPHCNRRRELGV